MTQSAQQGGVHEALKLIKSERSTRDIYGQSDETGSGSLLYTILQKAAKVSDESGSADTNSGISIGTKSHLIDKLVSRDLRDFNTTHAISLDAKKSSSVGLGHRS